MSDSESIYFDVCEGERCEVERVEILAAALDNVTETGDPETIPPAIEALKELLPKFKHQEKLLTRFEKLFLLAISARQGGDITAAKKRFPENKKPVCEQLIRKNIDKSAEWLYKKMADATGYSVTTMRRNLESFIQTEKKKAQK